MDRELARARTFARLLDHYGLDAALGFVLPGLGDVIGAVLGLYIVGLALRRRVSAVVVARMVMNLAIDLAIGLVPIAGDLADFAFRANTRNVALLEARATGRPRAGDWLLLAAVSAGFVAALAGSVYLVVAAVRWLAG
ncbi:MAG TPA: DUF4112 domain-containing protein [Kofleriaceae bacterium]|nr:DUF4112 domain-containing protein [Kofleriaceae bacterium]